MEICYKDFAQRATKGKGLFGGYSYSTLVEVVAEASLWIKDEQINVLNIETILLPTDNSSKSPIRVSGDSSSNWYQVIRIWFKATR